MDWNDDIFGEALSAFYFDANLDKLWVLSDKMEKDEMPVAHYFRNFKSMPDIEKVALRKCKGKVLDVGAGGGSHALWLQDQKTDITTIDISKGCGRVLKDRGVKRVVQKDVLAFGGEKFDTILLMMNGIGLSGTLAKLPDFLKHLKELLAINGQVLFDSSDLQYLYTEDDGSMLIDLNGPYYGEMNFRFAYKNKKGPWFKWLYIDEVLMNEFAINAGFKMEVLYRGKSSEYLARLSVEQ